jgi:aquaporin Z
MPSPAKLITELVGSFVFMTVIALSGFAGQFAPLAIGAALMSMVYMGGHVSGAHYNPAVSFGVFLHRKISATDLIGYWVAQVVGGVLAFVLGYLISGHAPGIHPGANVGFAKAVVVELVFTAGLVLVVLNVAATRATERNSFYGLAIGFAIAAFIFAGGPVSGGAYNPAVGLGATFASAVFGGGGWSDVWIYLVGPLAGGAIGAGIHRLQAVDKE